MTTALYVGRFQPLHNGHVRVISNILEECDNLIIVIGSSQKCDNVRDPLPYIVRRRLLITALKNYGVDEKRYKIYPVRDFGDDTLWIDYIYKHIPKFDAIYTGNPWLLKLFKYHSVQLVMLSRYKHISGTMIRSRIRKNKSWDHLVPKNVSIYIKRYGLWKKRGGIW